MLCSSMAWIRKRGETKDGRGRYLVEWRDPSGTRRGQTVVGRDAALGLKRALEDALVAGAYVDPSAGRVTFETFAGDWLRTRAHLRPKTVTRYEQLLRVHLTPALGLKALNAIRPVDVEALIADMLASGLAPGTVRQARAVLSSVMRTGIRHGLLSRSPVEGVRAPRSPREEQRYLSAAEVASLARTVPIAPRYSALVVLGAYAGLRFGELAGLRVDRLRILERRIDVRWSVSEDAGGRLVEGEPKWGSARTVTIASPIAKELARHLAAFPPGADGAVFTAPDGGPLRHRNFVERCWRPAVRSAGLEPLRPHDLRHTAVALAIGAGAHPKAVQEMLGHASITTTMDRYGHLFPALHDELAERLGETFAAARADSLPTDRAANVVALSSGSARRGS